MVFRGAIRIVVGVGVIAVGQTLVAQPTSQAAQDKMVHVNQIQIIGSHNSYHSGFAPSERKLLEMNHPKTLRGLDYRHAPLGDWVKWGCSSGRD